MVSKESNNMKDSIQYYIREKKTDWLSRIIDSKYV